MNIIDIQKLDNVVWHGSYYTAMCPICEDSKKNHLSVIDDVKFCCAKFPNDTNHNKQILQMVGTEVDNIPIIVKEPRIVQPQIWNKSCLSKLIKDYSYWNNRGIPSEIVEPFEGGVALNQGKLINRYVFPCYNEKNEITMFAARSINNSEPKWKLLGSKGNIYLFPHFAREEIIKSKIIIITESIGDNLALLKHNINNSIVIFGLNLSSKLMKFLIESNLNHIIISTNNDINKNSAGNKAAEEMKRKLLNFFNPDKIHVMLPNAKDWGESSESDILDFKSKIDQLNAK